MILDFMLDGEFPMSEFGDLECVMVGMMYLVLLLLVLLLLVVVCGGAVVVRDAHIHVAGMFAGAAAV
jgi:hypothetical protein